MGLALVAHLRQAAGMMPAGNRVSQSLSWCFSLLLLICAQNALYAQKAKSWLVCAEFGQAEIHRAESDAPVFGFRIGRNLERQGLIRLDLGLGFSLADEGSLTFDAGLELSPTPRLWVTPFVGVRTGLLAESEYAGTIFQGGAGVHFNLGQSAALRFAVYRGSHGGATGPNLLTGGVEYRF